jgi:hypothetical protein
MNRKRLLVVAVGVLVAAAIVGGVAYATIPGPGNVYSACMLKGVGTVRLIDKSLPSTNLMSHCTDKEIEVSWNQAGQPGPAGPVGPVGPAGAKGDRGVPGTNGTDGAAGKDGVSVTTASEPAGANCADGGVQVTAANGVSYVCNGKAGADGKDGTNGLNGADGRDGAPGPKGDKGDPCLPNDPACVGPQGDQGDPGLRYRGPWNPYGDYAATSVVEHSGSSWVSTQYACCGDEPGVSDKWSLLAAKGEQGPPGPDKQFTDRNTFYTVTSRQGGTVNVADGEYGQATAACDAGELPVGGGFSKSGIRLDVLESHLGPTGWYVRAFAEYGGAGTLTAYVVCAQPQTEITVQ